MASDTRFSELTRYRKKAWRWWLRYIWPVARHFIIPAVCVLALFVGLTAGYTVLGGRPMSEVWNLETWRHVLDLVFSDS